MLAYETMSVAEIAALPISDLADADAHLYVWTTQRYLWDTQGIVEVWGFKPVKVLVWCKPPAGFSVGGAYGNACEFVVFARRGSLPAQTRVSRDWWEWPRNIGAPVAKGQRREMFHSAKPEAFLDLVEQVSPGPYVELFARRARFGWDYWGDESLGTAEMPKEAAC